MLRELGKSASGQAEPAGCGGGSHRQGSMGVGSQWSFVVRQVGRVRIRRPLGGYGGEEEEDMKQPDGRG